MKNKGFSKTLSIVFLFVLLVALPIKAQKSKARAQFISLKRNNASFKGDKNGFDFEKVKFKYQFITCNNTLMLGVVYDKDAVFTQYWKNGKPYKRNDVKVAQWAKPEDIRINDVSADLFFGNTKLGKVKLTAIPERYSGCSGKVYEVLKLVGLNDSGSVFMANIDKLNLANLKVLKASVNQDL
tara:strand:- start:21729 stop:22277 length:549 start_codon:yes stop_codon:yes gene_type:complete